MPPGNACSRARPSRSSGAAEILADRRITTRPVPVSAAFHSRFVAEAQGPFRDAVEMVDFRGASIPVFANTTAEPYPDDPESVRELLAGQLARPVEFVAQVEAMYRSGARTFLEVGPDAKLTGLVRAILDGRPHLAIAVDASRGSVSNVDDLACSLATLAALGYAVNLKHWDEGESARVVPATKPGLTVRISGANARPKDRPTEGPRQKPAPVPEPSRPKAVAPRTPRFSLSEAMDPTMPDPQPRHHAENHRTMNHPERTPSHHSNGQAASHALHPPQAVEEHEPPVRVRSQTQDGAVPTDLAFAFHAVQENLAALQRLAGQTADLHRQFLEGQEKTQQTFLKLLEHQRRLSPAMPGPAEPPFSTPVPASEEKSPVMPATRSPAGGMAAPPEIPGLTGPTPDTLRPPRSRHARTKAATADDPTTLALIDVVAEKTGYPAEVLDLDMQLDADLGIDSIKRVEILSALQERYPDLPALPPEQLGSFPTIRAIAEFLGRDVARSLTERGNTPSTPSAPEDTQTFGPTEGREGSRAGFLVSPELARVLLETVAEKTGYPAEMLELDMRLDADLGIDSIKRVEIFSALQERYPGLPPAGPERIGTLETLRDIVVFLGETSEPEPDRPPLPEARAEPRPPEETATRALLEAVSEKTGYPVEMLELDMRLDTDLGIDSIKRVEIFSAVQERLPGTNAIGPEQTGMLETLRADRRVPVVSPLPGPGSERVRASREWSAACDREPERESAPCGTSPAVGQRARAF